MREQQNFGRIGEVAHGHCREARTCAVHNRSGIVNLAFINRASCARRGREDQPSCDVMRIKPSCEQKVRMSTEEKEETFETWQQREIPSNLNHDMTQMGARRTLRPITRIVKTATVLSLLVGRQQSILHAARNAEEKRKDSTTWRDGASARVEKNGRCLWSSFHVSRWSACKCKHATTRQGRFGAESLWIEDVIRIITYRV